MKSIAGLPVQCVCNSLLAVVASMLPATSCDMQRSQGTDGITILNRLEMHQDGQSKLGCK